MESSSASPILYDLVLVGCGHAHVHVLKMIGMMSMKKNQPTLMDKGIRVTIISSHYHTPYSGMLPGYIAGHYSNTTDDDGDTIINLNVIQLARFAHAKFIHATVNRITYNNSTNTQPNDVDVETAANNSVTGMGGYIYMTDGRPPIRYDCLSIDIGSAPSSTTTTMLSTLLQQDNQQQQPSYDDTTVIPVKPIANLCQYWDRIVKQYQNYLHEMITCHNNNHNMNVTSPYTIAIVGGGAGGIELAMSIQYRLMCITQSLSHLWTTTTTTTTTATATGTTTSLSEKSGRTISELLQVMIITRGNTILESSSINRHLIRKFQRILQERNIIVYCNAEVDSVLPVTETSSSSSSSASTCPTPQQQLEKHVGHNDHDNHIKYGDNARVASTTSLHSTTRTITTTRPIRKQILLKKTTTTQSQQSQHSVAPIIVDVCFSCITGTAASWLSDATPFTTTGSDKGNYLRVRPTYELIHHKGVFATGDCCHMDQHPRPKAGVFAVRAGPILYTNLLRYIFQNQKLINHHPQSTYLSIISTGDKYAVACKGQHFCIEGRYVWYIKDYIDRKWMAKYSTDLPDLETMMKEQQQPSRWWKNLFSGFNFFSGFNLSNRQIPTSNQWTQHHNKNSYAVEVFQENPMRCGGCGSKVGATIVSRVLRNVHDRQVVRAKEFGHSVMPPPIDHDDAAVTVLPESTNSSNRENRGAIIQTIDYFREMISDPYIFGKIVAVHALSDIHAMGICAQSAMALAVVPFAADDNITESTLLHLLSGVSDVLQDENISLVGGHTCEGTDLACGLSIQGYTDHPTTLWRKRGGQIGDQIILTKPIGTGALFAAEMRAKASGDHIAEAIEGMLVSNYNASCAAREFCNRHNKGAVVHACTDVTGFGLIGHLLEMLLANDTSTSSENDDNGSTSSIQAVLMMKNIPFYRGGISASRKNIYSSLQKQNERNRRAVCEHSATALKYPIEYPLLFDPQTAGGLLFFVHPTYCCDFVSYLRKDRNVSQVSVIGEVQAYAANFSKEVEATITSTISEACTIGNHLGRASTENRIRID